MFVSLRIFKGGSLSLSLSQRRMPSLRRCGGPTRAPTTRARRSRRRPSAGSPTETALRQRQLADQVPSNTAVRLILRIFVCCILSLCSHRCDRADPPIKCRALLVAVLDALAEGLQARRSPSRSPQAGRRAGTAGCPADKRLLLFLRLERRKSA